MPKPYVLPLVFMFPSRTIFVEVADVLAFQQELKESVHEEGLKGISHIGLAVRYLRSGRPWRTWEQYITSFAPPG